MERELGPSGVARLSGEGSESQLSDADHDSNITGESIPEVGAPTSSLAPSVASDKSVEEDGKTQSSHACHHSDPQQLSDLFETNRIQKVKNSVADRLLAGSSNAQPNGAADVLNKLKKVPPVGKTLENSTEASKASKASEKKESDQSVSEDTVTSGSIQDSGEQPPEVAPEALKTDPKDARVGTEGEPEPQDTESTTKDGVEEDTDVDSNERTELAEAVEPDAGATSRTADASSKSPEEEKSMYQRVKDFFTPKWIFGGTCLTAAGVGVTYLACL